MSALPALSHSAVGEGIFHRIQRLLQLGDPREAILELAKGKLTIDPARHRGEGIFFTSRSVDHFATLPRELLFAHDTLAGDWIIDTERDDARTSVHMRLSNDSTRDTKAVFAHVATVPRRSRSTAPLCPYVSRATRAITSSRARRRGGS